MSLKAQVGDVLIATAQSYRKQRKPLQAIRCLEALCQDPTSLYPEQEALIRLEVRDPKCLSSAQNKMTTGWEQ